MVLPRVCACSVLLSRRRGVSSLAVQVEGHTCVWVRHVGMSAVPHKACMHGSKAVGLTMPDERVHEGLRHMQC